MSASILTVDALSIRYAATTAVDTVSFSLAKGEVLGIVGESGSGKSQILLRLMDLLPPQARQTGRVTLEAKRRAIMFQDPMTALNPYLRIGIQVAEGISARARIADPEIRARVLAMLQALRIADPVRRIDQYPHELSGGMRQRVLLAAALIGQPDLLLLDEPTTALDVTVQADILDLLAAERQDRGTAMLFVTHDLGVAARLCDRILVLKQGRMIEMAATESLFAAPEHPYTRQLLSLAPRMPRLQS